MSGDDDALQRRADAAAANRGVGAARKQGAVYVPQFFDAAVGNYSDFTFVNLLPYGVQIHASAQNGVLTVLFCRAEEDSQ